MVQNRSHKALILSALVIVAVVGVLWCWFSTRLGCDDDVQETPIGGSKWVVLTKVYRCSAIDGYVTISARNTATKQEADIVYLDEESIPVVEVISPKEIQLTFENLVDIVSSKNSFGDIRVTYKFTPNDDPVARHKYQFWAHHPNDPRAIQWSQAHFKTAH